MRVSWRIMIACVVAACGGETEEDDIVERQTPCMQLRDHTVELRMRTASGTPREMDDLRAGFRRALGQDFLQSCEQNLSRQQIECSLQAADLNGMSACAEATPSSEKQP